jgi:hypothetical protein
MSEATGLNNLRASRFLELDPNVTVLYDQKQIIGGRNVCTSYNRFV